MKLKFFTPPASKSKYNKERLLRFAFREACAQLVFNGRYNTYQAAYNALMKKAKEQYAGKRKF